MTTTIGTIVPTASRSNHLIARPPSRFEIVGKSVFLAGSTERNIAPDWQSQITSLLSTRLPNQPLTILNPRRDDWDSSWKESIQDERFREQVNWELDAQDAATFIAMYLHPGTKGVVSLLELGLHAKESGKVVVCCPDGYWRKGNVEVVCQRYGIKLCEQFEQFEEEVVRMLRMDN